MAQLRRQLEHAVERSRGRDAEGDRVAELLVQQRCAIGEASARYRAARQRDLRLLAVEPDPLLSDLYRAVAGAFGIGCDVATDRDAVLAAQQDAEHALVLADPKLREAIGAALDATPRPMLIMTPAVPEVSVALQSPYMERSLGMLVKPFELEPLTFIIAHWTYMRTMNGEG